MNYMKLLQKIILVTTIILGINLALPVFVMAQSPPPVYSFQFGSAGSGNGQFNTPYGVAIDSAGNIFVADSNNNRIQKFNSSGPYISQFGTSGAGDGQFNRPIGVAFDVSGNIYVANNGDNRVQKFNSSFTHLLTFNLVGAFAYGQGIDVDASGNIYVVDQNNDRIQKFNSSGVYQSQIGSAGSGNGELSGPDGVAVDALGNIYVADTGNSRVQKFNSSGTYLSQFGTNGSGDGQFITPIGIAFDTSGNIYVVDYISDRVQIFDSSGSYISQFGTSGTGNGQFDTPIGIAVDTSDNIYVVDMNNQRIQVFDTPGPAPQIFGYGPDTGLDTGGTAVDFTTSNNVAGAQVLFDGIAATITLNNPYTDMHVTTPPHAAGLVDVVIVNPDTSTSAPVGFTYTASPPPPPPDPIIDLGATGGSEEVTLTWTAPFDNGNAITSYTVQYGTVSSGLFNQTCNTISCTDTTTGAVISGLAAGTTYQFRAYANNAGGPSPVSNIVLASTDAIPTSSFGQGEEIIQPGVLQLTSVPANFSFPAVDISEFQTYNTIYINQQTVPERLTAEDKRFEGGFEVQITATEYVGQNNPANTIPVGNLGIMTQAPSAVTAFQQTDRIENIFNTLEGSLITGSQGDGIVVTQTLPFYFPMFGRESNQLIICSSGFMVSGANLAGLQAGDFAALCATPTIPAPVGNYGGIFPYHHPFGPLLTTRNDGAFDLDNGIFYEQVSDTEVHIRYKTNKNDSDLPVGSIEFTVALFKDGRIEYHYGPVIDTVLPESVGILDTETLSQVLITIPPFTGFTSGSEYNNNQIRFSPISAIFNDISKPDTPPVYALTNANSTSNPANYTMFVEDIGDPGFSVPVTTMEGAACLYHGRLGNYTLYPSFMLQIPPTTEADTYQNTITFTIIDNTLNNGTQFCPPV